MPFILELWVWLGDITLLQNQFSQVDLFQLNKSEHIQAFGNDKTKQTLMNML
jgi:hypothetical protein